MLLVLVITDGDKSAIEFIYDEHRKKMNTARKCCTRRLKPIYREILEYRYIAEYSVKETAAALGIKESAVTTRQNRALKILRELYESEESEANG